MKKILFIICVMFMLFSSIGYCEDKTGLSVSKLDVKFGDDNSVVIDKDITMKLKTQESFNLIKKVKSLIGLDTVKLTEEDEKLVTVNDYEDTSFKYERTTRGFKETIILNSAPTYDTISYEIDTGNKKYNLENNVLYVWDDDKFGQFNQPYILEDNITLPVSYEDGIYTIYLTNIDWSKYTYPLKIDPSYEELENLIYAYFDFRNTYFDGTNWYSYSDANGYNYTAALKGFSSANFKEPLGNSYLAYNSSSYINITNDDNYQFTNGPSTVCMWYSDDSAGSGYIFDAYKLDYVHGWMYLTTSNTAAKGNDATGASQASFTANLYDTHNNIWSFICVSSDDRYVNVYVNNNTVQNAASSGSMSAWWYGPANTVTVGSDYAGNNKHSGNISMIFMMNTLISQSQVNWMWNNGNYRTLFNNWVNMGTPTIKPTEILDNTDINFYCDGDSNSAGNLNYTINIYKNNAIYDNFTLLNQPNGTINVYSLTSDYLSPTNTFKVGCYAVSNDSIGWWINSSTYTVKTSVNMTISNAITGTLLSGIQVNVTDGITSTKTTDSNGMTFYNLTSGTYYVSIQAPGYGTYTNNFTVTNESGIALNYSLSFNQNFNLYDEKTLNAFNMSDLSSATFYLYCPANTYQYNINVSGSSNITIPIACYYSGFRFYLDFGTDYGSVYRNYLTLPSEEANVKIYLPNAKTSTVYLENFLLDDAFEQYQNKQLYIYKYINGAKYLIHSDNADATSTVSSYLLVNNEYYLEVHSSNQPIKDIGVFNPITSTTTKILLWSITLLPQASDIYQYITYNIGIDNGNNIIANYSDKSGLTSSIIYSVWVNNTMYCEQTATSNNVLFNCSSANYSYGRMDILWNGYPYYITGPIQNSIPAYNMTITDNLLSIVDQGTINWIVLVALLIIGLSLTPKFATLGGIVILCGCGLLIFINLISGLIVSVIVSLLFIGIILFFKEQSVRREQL